MIGECRPASVARIACGVQRPLQSRVIDAEGVGPGEVADEACHGLDEHREVERGDPLPHLLGRTPLHGGDVERLARAIDLAEGGSAQARQLALGRGVAEGCHGGCEMGGGGADRGREARAEVGGRAPRPEQETDDERHRSTEGDVLDAHEADGGIRWPVQDAEGHEHHRGEGSLTGREVDRGPGPRCRERQQREQDPQSYGARVDGRDESEPDQNAHGGADDREEGELPRAHGVEAENGDHGEENPESVVDSRQVHHEDAEAEADSAADGVAHPGALPVPLRTQHLPGRLSGDRRPHGEILDVSAIGDACHLDHALDEKGEDAHLVVRRDLG